MPRLLSYYHGRLFDCLRQAAILSAAICVTMFALGFGMLISISGAVSSLADLVGVAAAMVVLGLLFG
jgi:hypothetical protein